MKRFKVYKVFDCILIAISYMAAYFVYIGGITYRNNPDCTEIFNSSRVTGLVFYVILFVLQFAVYIFGLINSLSANESMAKHNMIVKLASVPFFILNFFALFGLTSDCLTINVPLNFVVGALSIIGTFSIMFRTSFPNLVYFIKSYIKKTLKPTAWSVLALISSFIFSLDVIGGIILFKHERNQRPDIAARIREEKLKKIEKWQIKEHKSLLSFKIESLVTYGILLVTSVVPVVVFFIDYGMYISTNGLDIIQVGKWIIFLPIIACVISLVKFIMGIRYGKRGEENPTSFMLVMKILDIIPTIALLSIALICGIIGALMDAVAIFLLAFIAVVVVIFMIMALLAGSMIVYMVSAIPMMGALFCIWSSSLSVFTYFINQRAMKNRKIKNPLIIACLVCLWFPIVDIPALIILKNKSKSNEVFSDIPVIE